VGGAEPRGIPPIPIQCLLHLERHSRHSAATHLLRGGVDINTIRGWLGHVTVETTNIYAAVNLETKEKAIAHCEPGAAQPARRWAEDKGLMTFLQSL